MLLVTGFSLEAWKNSFIAKQLIGGTEDFVSYCKFFTKERKKLKLSI